MYSKICSIKYCEVSNLTILPDGFLFTKKIDLSALLAWPWAVLKTVGELPELSLIFDNVFTADFSIIVADGAKLHQKKMMLLVETKTGFYLLGTPTMPIQVSEGLFLPGHRKIGGDLLRFQIRQSFLPTLI